MGKWHIATCPLADHKAPSEDCSCGFYTSLNTYNLDGLVSIMDWASPDTVLIPVLVELSGDIVVHHEEMVRAEALRPIALVDGITKTSISWLEFIAQRSPSGKKCEDHIFPIVDRSKVEFFLERSYYAHGLGEVAGVWMNEARPF